MIRSKLRGTGVALVTPFTKSGSVDYPGLEKLINHVIDGGVEYVVSLGTTGESVTLSAEEKIEVLDFTIEKTAKRVPVVAGFGGNNTDYLIKQEIEKYHFKGDTALIYKSSILKEYLFELADGEKFMGEDYVKKFFQFT